MPQSSSKNKTRKPTSSVSLLASLLLLPPAIFYRATAYPPPRGHDQAMRRRRARPEKEEAAAAPSFSFSVGPSPHSSAGEKDTNDACPPLPPPTGPPAASSRKSPTHLALLGILYSLLLRTLSFILNIITKRFVSSSPRTPLGRAT